MWLAASKLILNMTDRIPTDWFQAKVVKFYSIPTATISQFPIKQVSTVKSLGVRIDENLTWECHINELSKKIASGISTIKFIRHSVPYKTLLYI